MGGDVFAFRMRHDGLEFPDAVRSLAREVGVEIPLTGADADTRTHGRKRRPPSAGLISAQCGDAK